MTSARRMDASLPPPLSASLGPLTRSQGRVAVLDRYVDTFNVGSVPSAPLSVPSEPTARIRGEQKQSAGTLRGPNFSELARQPESLPPAFGAESPLEIEKRNREAAEMLARDRGEVLRERTAQLHSATSELAHARANLQASEILRAEEREAAAATNRTLTEQLAECRWKLACHQAEPEALERLSWEMHEELEECAVRTLAAVHARKQRLRKEREADDHRTACIVCMSESRQVCFAPCGHVICCRGCSQQVSACPACRERIVKRIDAFL